MALSFAARGQTVVQDSHGEAQALASVLVKAPDGTTATLYTDRTKATTVANPILADALGQLEFYTGELGVHSLVITTPAGAFTREVNVEVDPADDAFQDDIVAVRAYVDQVAAGKNVKDDVRVATTGPITLSGAQTIDGVAVVAADRVLVKDQASGAANGIYAAAAGAWARTADADSGPELLGAVVFVRAGSTQALTAWEVTNDAAITVGTTPIVWAQASGGVPAGVELQANKDADGGYVGRASDGSVNVPVIHTRDGPAVDLMHSYFDTVDHTPTGTPNTMMQRRVAADAYAAAFGLPVFVPPGNYVVHFANTGVKQQFVQQAGRWFSLAAGLCTIEFPDRMGFATDAWTLDGTVDTRIDNITIKGPTTNKGLPFTIVDRGVYDPAATYNYGDKVSYTAPAATSAAFYECWVDGTVGVLPTVTANWIRDRGYVAGTTVSYGVPDANLANGVTRTSGAGNVESDHVWIDGWFANAYDLGSAGTVAGTVKTTKITGGRAQSWSTALLANQNTGTFHQLEVVGVEFQGDPAINNTLHHHIYVNPSVSTHLERCSFYNRKGGYCVHRHGSATEAPLWDRVIDCYFDASNDRAALPSEMSPHSEYRGNMIRCPVAFSVGGGGLEVDGGEIWGSVGTSSKPRFANPKIRFRDVTFRDQGRVSTGNGTTWNGAIWTLDDCKWDVNLASNTSCVTSTGPEVELYINNPRVYSTSSQGRFLTWNRGTCDVAGGVLAGTYLSSIWWPREALSQDARLFVSGVDMSKASGPPFAAPLVASSDTIGKAVFEDCLWPLSAPTATVQGGVQIVVKKHPANPAKFPATIALASTTLITSTPRFRQSHVRRQVTIPGAGPAGADLVTTITGYTDSQHVTVADAASVAINSGTLTIAKSLAGVDVNENATNVTLPPGGVGAAPNDVGALITFAALNADGSDFVTTITGVNSATDIDVSDPLPAAGAVAVSWSRTATDATVTSGSGDVFSASVGWNAADVGATGSLTNAGVAGATLTAAITSVNAGANTGHFATNASTTVNLQPTITLSQTIVSAATIFASHNADIYDIAAGSVTTITTIQVGGTAAAHRTAAGIVRFRMPGGVAFGTGGNLSLRPGTSGVAVPAGTVVEFAFNPLTGNLHQLEASGIGTVMAGLADAAGDMVYASGDDAWQKVAIGSSGKVWTVTGAGTLGWATPPANPASLPIMFNQPGVSVVAVGKAPWPVRAASTLLGVSLAAGTAPTGADIIVDLNKNGATVFTTQANRPRILAGATESAAEVVPDVTALAAGDLVTADVDQVGSTVAGADLVVFVAYREN